MQSTHVGLARACAAALLLCCALAVGAASHKPRGESPRITLMTWNIYYGGGADGGIPDMGDMWESVEATNFPERATRIARIIEQQQPHIICLQEVARWSRDEVIGSDDDTIDFLEVLLARLEARGLNYDVTASLTAIDFEAPGIIDGDPWDVHWQERIVMLTRHSGHLQVNTVREKYYNDFVTIAIPANEDLAFNRGWLAVDIAFRGKKARYVCTHLEALSNSVAEDQAAQLIEWLSGTSLPVIVMGDMNSLPASPLYQQFIDAGYQDAWTDNHGLFDGPTCCQDGDLQNNSSELTTRIDQIFLRGSLTPISSARAGHKTADQSSSGLWPSDHACVVAKVQLD
jgi:endonuclease/exonuclease/phosphatase family metal-dependent hydrolase